MAARESPQIIEDERERAESPTPLAEGLMRSYRGPGGGECSAVQLRLIGLSEGHSVYSPKNWPHGLQKDSHLAEALGSHPAIHCFLTGLYERRR
jgi:hypothetical protein